MRRSVILITVILTLCVSLGVWMDVSQQRVAREYLDSVRLIRDLADGGQQEQACDEQRYLHAQWQHDAVWLNYLISHHHTRAVSAAMVELATALERRWDTGWTRWRTRCATWSRAISPIGKTFCSKIRIRPVFRSGGCGKTGRTF